MFRKENNLQTGCSAEYFAKRLLIARDAERVSRKNQFAEQMQATYLRCMILDVKLNSITFDITNPFIHRQV
jgi:hypothetical protein